MYAISEIPLDGKFVSRNVLSYPGVPKNMLTAQAAASNRVLKTGTRILAKEELVCVASVRIC